jgi:uncharacterized membrane protein YbaN (DUF454 family)
MARPAWLTQQVKRKLYIGAGIFFIVIGIAGLVLPILQGFLFIALGLVLLSKGSSRVRALKQRFKQRYPEWGAKLTRAEKWSQALPGRTKNRIRRLFTRR